MINANVVRPTVEELKKLATIDIGKYIKRNSGRVEANVKEKIVIPLLSFLGYDKIKDMDFELNVRNKFIDIAIILNSKPKLIVETKDLSENLDNHIEQALNYAFFTGVDYVVLTNGYSIRLYKSYVAHSDLKDRLLCSLSLCDIAEEFYKPMGLWEIISKDKLIASKPLLENIRELRDRLNKEAIFLDSIVEGFNKKPNKTELLNNAFKLQKSYEYDKAIFEYRKCLTLDDITDSEKIVILNFIGNCFFCLCRINEAIGHYSEAYIIAKRSNQIEAICEFFENMSHVQFFKGELDNALISIKESQNINIQIKNLVSESNLNELYGRITRVKGKIDEALEYFKKALDINQHIGYRQGEASTLEVIGRLMRDQGKNDEALEYFKKALDINQRIGYWQGEAASLDGIGRLFHTQGKNNEALEYFKKALDINQRIGYRQGEASNFDCIGKLYRDQGKNDKALSYSEEALKINREIGYRQGEAASLDGIGRLFHTQGKNDKALSYLEKALKMNREIGYRQGEAMNLYFMGKCYEIKQNWIEAFKVFKESKKINYEIGTVYYFSDISRKIRKISKLLSDNKNNHNLIIRK